jgi:hypothetical protein
MSQTPESSETDSLSESIADLESALATLRSQLDEFKLRFEHFGGDLTLYGVLLSAWENASAVLHLARTSDLYSAFFPIARAAFESGQEALYLVTEQDYDAAGAKARVFERLEFVDLRDDMNTAFADSDDERPSGYADAVDQIERDARRWDEESPGKGDFLRNALSHFQPLFEAARSGARHPSNWMQKSRRAIAMEIEKRVKEPGFGGRMIASYAHLSRNSHPRLRMENWTRVSRPGGRKQFIRAERNPRIAVGVSTVAVSLASMAFERIPPSDSSTTAALGPE